jgi:hypothetical protein
MRQGGALRRPLYRDVDRSSALGADTSLAEEPGAAVTASSAGAALEAAAVETAVGVDAVVAAEGGSTNRRALGVRCARPTKGDIAATEAATNWLTDALSTIEPATTLGPSGAAAALIAAAVQRTIAGDPIVVAENRSSHLAAFAGTGALTTKPDGATATAGGPAGPVRAEQASAANGVAVAGAAIVMAAVQDAVRVNPVRRTDHRSRSLAALSGLRAFRAERQSTGAVVRAETIDTVESTATSRTVVAAGTGAAFVAAAIQRTVTVIAVVCADRRAAALAALLGRSALRPGSEATRCRRSR